MILVHGQVRVREGHVDALLAAARPMIEASRRELGCAAYRYSFDVLDPHVLYFHEEWESEEALAAHFRTPHLAEFSETVRDHVDGPLTILRSTVAETGPLRV